MRCSFRSSLFSLLMAGIACAPLPARADVRQQVAEAEALADTDPEAALRRLDALAATTRGHDIRDVLDVEVQDDGIGFDVHAGEGVGLANVRERLRLLHGNRAQLIIEKPHDGGARAIIRVPFAPDIFAGSKA